MTELVHIEPRYRGATAVARSNENCVTCGNPHYGWKLKTRPDLAPLWGDPYDGHPFRSQPIIPPPFSTPLNPAEQITLPE